MSVVLRAAYVGSVTSGSRSWPDHLSTPALICQGRGCRGPRARSRLAKCAEDRSPSAGSTSVVVLPRRSPSGAVRERGSSINDILDSSLTDELSGTSALTGQPVEVS